MKKFRLIGTLFSLAIIYIVFTASSGGRATAANDDRTGAPGSAGTCGNCHSGGSYGTVTTLIEAFTQGTTNAVTAYTAGTTYDIKVTVSNSAGTPAGYGFEFTCLTTPGNTPVTTTFTNLASNVKQKLVTAGTFNGRRFAEHNGVTSSNVFTFRWTAPTAGTGSIKFYACGLAVNGLNGDNGDNASAGASLTLTESVVTNPLSVTGTVTNVSCNGGNNGAISITPAGGTSPYTYNWGGGITAQNRSNLAAGTYTVTVTDNTSATSTATFTVTQPAAVTASGTPTNILCNGGNNGAINITAAGGTGPYTYNWGSGVTTEDRTNLTAGTYTVTVTDTRSCTGTATFTLTQPAAVSVSGTPTNILCNGGNNGAINITATGGTAPYTYNWGNSVTTEDRTNLTAGTYTVTVSDSRSCTGTATYTLTQPAALSASNTPGTINCFGGNTTIAVTGSGGTSPYTGTGTFTVTAGNYSYTVTDNNGCTATTAANITQPTQLTASANNITIPCTGGSGTVTVTASGGTAPYTGTGNFTVTTPGIQNYQVTDSKGCTATATSTVSSSSGLSVTGNTTSLTCNGVCNGAVNVTVTGGSSPYTYAWSNNTTTPNQTGLCAGTYTQTVTDNANCSIVNSFVVNDVPALQTTVNADSVLCYGGSAAAVLNVSGGTSPYSYQWSNNATTTATTLNAGSYSYTVTDDNGCTITSSGSISQPDSLQSAVTSVTNDDGTGNGAIDITVGGGTPPYTYNWSNSSTTQDVAQLTNGAYSVTITDANGCVKTIPAISIINTSVPDLTADFAKVYPNPFTNTITVSVTAETELRIYNVEGMLQKQAVLQPGSNPVDVSDLATSVYIIHLQQGEKSYRARIAKAN
jgi:hypothetical protein